MKCYIKINIVSNNTYFTNKCHFGLLSAISMEERILPRHFISMEEPKIITIGDVTDSNVMHINKANPLFARESKGNPDGTHWEPSNAD